MSDKPRNQVMPSARTAAVYIVFFLSLSLLLTLGGWQWRRGLEKAAVETLLARSSDQYITIDRAPPNWSGLAYRRVRLQGRWLPDRVFLLANRIHRGQPGYEVFSPFELAGDDATLLVNRGWIESAAALQTNPSAQAETAQAEATGQLYLPKKGFTLGRAYDPDAAPQWPKVIQYLDAPALSAALGTALQPAALALDSDHPGVYARIWQAYAMNATRHYAYAAQWWGLAATLLVFGFIWRRQSTRAGGGRDGRAP